MRHKVGDKVRVKSINWYNENENLGIVNLIGTGSRYNFTESMSEHCGQIVTICGVDCVDEFYDIVEDYGDFFWTDSMFEDIECDNECENKYRLDKSDDDKLATEVTCDDFKLVSPDNYLIGKVTPVDDGMLVEFVKKQQKQPQYPKTYFDCCDELGLKIVMMPHASGYKSDEINALQVLIVCRNAYWKLAGEQMGLGKPWEPDWSNGDETKFCIYTTQNIISLDIFGVDNRILAFPSEEMRNAFFENFKHLIKICKKLL